MTAYIVRGFTRTGRFIREELSADTPIAVMQKMRALHPDALDLSFREIKPVVEVQP